MHSRLRRLEVVQLSCSKSARLTETGCAGSLSCSSLVRLEGLSAPTYHLRRLHPETRVLRRPPCSALQACIRAQSEVTPASTWLCSCTSVARTVLSLDVAW